MSEIIQINTEDGVVLTGRYRTAPGSRLGAVVINSATGVRRSYYDDFAGYLVDAGYDVFTWDARGIGGSARQSPQTDPARMRDWGHLDLEAVLQHINREQALPWSELHVIGHSSGGHLCGLAPSLSKVGSLCLVAAGTGYWRLYDKLQWPRMLLLWRMLLPLTLRSFGYLPARLGIGHALPRGVAQDWAKWCLLPNYLFDDETLDTRGYGQFRGPLLAISMADDHGFAPPAAVQALVAQFALASVQRVHIAPSDHSLKQIGHFGFFRPSHAVLWPHIRTWLTQVKKE